MKLTLILNIISPALSWELIRGEKEMKARKI
jgi:hypothetical protein